jgi:UDP-N-acetylmuramoyl-L-alanyl-D-glutamate--2,6-diaminopimelate ligase
VWLSDLIEEPVIVEAEVHGQQSTAGIEIAGLTADSRAVRPGWLFAALPGTRTDGRSFIDSAIERGAVAVLAPQGTSLKAGTDRVALITDANPRRRLALLAARFFGAQPRMLAAVTGTNGKTSVADFTRQIWAALGHRAASIGTLGLIAPEDVALADAPRASLTTPDPIALHRDLADLARAGVDHLSIEASSHGLDQHRLDGLRVSAAAFTNLTRDHLDYHATMEAYLAAKLRLFDSLMAADGTAVLNADSAHFEHFAKAARARGQRVLSYGRAGRDIRLLAQTPQADGQVLEIDFMGRRAAVQLAVAGSFQGSNVLCALGLAVATGAALDAALGTLGRLRGVRGRIERVASHPNGAAIYVDYAHTPDALETVLTALRPHAMGRLVVVFGAGGDRDRGKRPQMGAVSARLADRVYVTNDNPRSEDPAAIRAEIMPACPDATEIGDRGEAIRQAVAALEPGDLLVIAGKGHESGQTVGGVTHPFDDAVVARAAVADLVRGARS